MTEIVKRNISEIEEKKGGKLKKGDIALITKKEHDKWISIVGKVLFIDKEKVKIATPVSAGRQSGPKVEIFQTELSNEDIKLSFGEKEDLASTIYTMKQSLKETENRLKKEYEDSKIYKENFNDEVLELFGNDNMFL